ncbi:hypothetical protein NC99_07270 [Sunxiuqinia dokdonensis]|uniref:Uncharacterized protein n=1 Tax=Sunxiuqinia dokdonensis TaxID=1409788 RepID=A0A0L8VE63_9BACT|nr:hypothetical protein NC99_07270 [Sunxiuqinia dokdonensis]
MYITELQKRVYLFRAETSKIGSRFEKCMLIMLPMNYFRHHFQVPKPNKLIQNELIIRK